MTRSTLLPWTRSTLLPWTRSTLLPWTRSTLLAMCSLTLLIPAASARAADPPAPGTGIHYLYLIRHGMYDKDPDPNADDAKTNGLNGLGHEQARLVGAKLAALPIKPAAFVTSNFRRARETAEDIGQVLGRTPAVDTLIHECTPASDRADVVRRLTAGELAACDSNLVRAWAKYMVPTPEGDRHDVLVCHGNVIRWFVARAVAGDSRRWGWMEMANASITILAVRPDGTLRLVCFNDVGHLPVAKQTWTGNGAGWGAPPPGPPPVPAPVGSGR
jgi:serine/threonine-protein phosphatase PGAM5